MKVIEINVLQRDWKSFNFRANELIQMGFQPFGSLQLSGAEYVQMFVKYEVD